MLVAVVGASLECLGAKILLTLDSWLELPQVPFCAWGQSFAFAFHTPTYPNGHSVGIWDFPKSRHAFIPNSKPKPAQSETGQGRWHRVAYESCTLPPKPACPQPCCPHVLGCPQMPGGGCAATCRTGVAWGTVMSTANTADCCPAALGLCPCLICRYRYFTEWCSDALTSPSPSSRGQVCARLTAHRLRLRRWTLKTSGFLPCSLRKSQTDLKWDKAFPLHTFMTGILGH